VTHRPDRLVLEGAEAIRLAFERYREQFRQITRRARGRFDRREWDAGQEDAIERLALYRRTVDASVEALTQLLGDQCEDPALWGGMRAIHTRTISGLPDAELAETFFNSVTRHVFTTVGVDPEIEYVVGGPGAARAPKDASGRRSFHREGSLTSLVEEVLDSFGFQAAFRDLHGDAALVSQRIAEDWDAAGCGDPIDSIELVDTPFYRGMAAYLVGRISSSSRITPIVLVLLHRSEGIEVDTVLLTREEISIVFSYTRAYFQADVARPSDIISFLRYLMPRKPVAELYISLGLNKHGKTELFRDLLGHVENTPHRFEAAAGERGMVMIVFAMPGHEYVFKVIRDEFDQPKTITHEEVRERYQFVFQHDRAGRLLDAQEFEHLTFSRHRFTPELFEELTTQAAKSVSVQGDDLVIHHLYMERRVRPLNIFLREQDEERAHHAVRDYGQALRDLAAMDVFPGDLLLKNFGVTRSGRVIFYDYDELALVTEQRFRELPRARDDDEEMSAEPWFHVGPCDVFPEEFPRFLSFTPEQRVVFGDAHAEVFTAAYWRDIQQRHRSGELLDVLPYPPSKRLRG
jgi:isocitrate dehydrogenase kinase/phosphatase